MSAHAGLRSKSQRSRLLGDGWVLGWEQLSDRLHFAPLVTHPWSWRVDDPFPPAFSTHIGLHRPSFTLWVWAVSVYGLRSGFGFFHLFILAAAS